MRQPVLALTLLIAFNALSAAAAVTAGGQRDAGLTHLTAGRWQHAEACLRQAISEQPNDACSHYYLANALVYLGKHRDAIAEYEKSYRLDPYGPVSGYCRRALISYRVQVSDVPSGSEPDDLESAPRIRNFSPGKGSDPVVVTVEKIRRDANTAKNRQQQIADAMADVVMQTADQHAQQIQAIAKEEIDRIMNPTPLIGGRLLNPLLYNPELQKIKVEEVRRNAEEAIALERRKADERTSSYKQWTQNTAFALDEAAANLEKQLHDRNLPGTPRLTAAGTSLYVRNYSAPEKPSPYPDPHQGVVRIQRNNVGLGDSGVVAPSEGEALHERQQPEADVRGVVLRK